MQPATSILFKSTTTWRPLRLSSSASAIELLANPALLLGAVAAAAELRCVLGVWARRVHNRAAAVRRSIGSLTG